MIINNFDEFRKSLKKGSGSIADWNYRVAFDSLYNKFLSDDSDVRYIVFSRRKLRQKFSKNLTVSGTQNHQKMSDEKFSSDINHLSTCRLTRENKTGSEITYGSSPDPVFLTPIFEGVEKSVKNDDFEALDCSGFGSLKSVSLMRSSLREGIVVGFDTEFFYENDERVVLSYQFAVIDYTDPAYLCEVVLIPGVDGQRISIESALWEVVKETKLHKHPLVKGNMGKYGSSFGNFKVGGDRDGEWLYGDDFLEARRLHKVPISLVGHYQNADITAFRTDKRGSKDVILNLSSVGGGLVSLQDFYLTTWDYTHKCVQNIYLKVGDTMAHSPAGKQSLKDLGESCGVSKLEVPNGFISKMNEYRDNFFLDFLDYGSNDAVVCVEYVERLWGEGVAPAATITSAAASAVVSMGRIEFGGISSEEFRRTFSGIKTSGAGVNLDEDNTDAFAFYRVLKREPVDGAAETVINAFARAYHGGLNACPMPGYFELPTIDIDAQNAYPTAMSCVKDVDYSEGVIGEIIQERLLTSKDIKSPNDPVVCFVSDFEFPDDVKFPCIPIRAEGTLIYPRTCGDSGGAWVAAPELYLALKLGARVFVQIGFKCRVLKGLDGKESYFLSKVVKQFVADRNKAKEIYGKNSLEDLMLKTCVNSIYGKTAQDISEQHSWHAKFQEMVDVGGSSITSSYHAAMTTSIVRAQLLAVLNDLHEKNFDVYSVTTDGFITNSSLDVVENSAMSGFNKMIRKARKHLTGKPEIWEIKHSQNHLLNFTTRGNVSLDDGGVCAHNSFKPPAGVVKNSFEDRLLLMEVVASRTGKVSSKYLRHPSFRELSLADKSMRKDFIPRVIKRELSMDFDLKREPIFESMRPKFVTLPDGRKYEIATFDTKPWETVRECLIARELGRKISKSGRALRTVEDWLNFRIELLKNKNARYENPSQAILKSILIGHRQNVFKLPVLENKKIKVDEKLSYLNSLGLGEVTLNDWKNSRRPERLHQMLPLDLLKPYLTDLGCDISLPEK